MAVTFQPADPPRLGRIALWSTEIEGAPAGFETEHLELALPERRSVPVRRLPVEAAIDWLIPACSDERAHPTAAFWGTATLLALQLVARGRLIPAVSPDGYDSWRIGFLDDADVERIGELAEAMPPEARAIPVPGATDPVLPSRHDLLRDFLDAIADTLPRHADGTLPFGGTGLLRVPQLRDWAADVAARLDGEARLSLRIDLPGGVEALEQLDPDQPGDSGFAAVLQAPRHPNRAREDGDLLVRVRRAAQVWPPLGRLLDRATPGELSLSDEELADLLGPTATRLAAVGIDVSWPRYLDRDLTSRAVATGNDASSLGGFFGGDAAVGLEWQLTTSLGPLTEAEMDALAAAHRPVVRLRDRWTLVDPELARKAQARLLKPLTPIEALAASLTGTVEVDGKRTQLAPSEWLERLRAAVTKSPIVPDTPLRQESDRRRGTGRRGTDCSSEPGQDVGLVGRLREYQVEGVRWLVRMAEYGLGGCLADDMGLGKTVTLIAVHLNRQRDPETAGQTLVVCPASLLGNWEREIRRFAPETRVDRYHAADRELEDGSGIVLTTYATMRRDADRLRRHRWSLVVADEAQHVKNPRSATARALRTIPAQARIALTGTPVENNLSDLWSILDWTTPGLLGRLGTFRTRWADPIESGDRETAALFARLVQPFLLRRKKSDPGVAPELPPKTETEHPVSLMPEQIGLYRALADETMDRIRAGSGIARRGLILKLLTGLKQICNHPAHYLKQPGPTSGRSGKLELLDELIETIVAEDGSVLVFTQYVAMARLLERHLAVPSLLLHGGTPVRQREEMVERFQSGAVPVFLLSLKAAGTGLNLTRADHVVHYDRWWNPAVEDQATDRAYRIGQTRPVQVHRLVAEGTVEDRIAELLAGKRALADAVLTSGEAALTELSDAELAALVDLT